MLLSVPPPARVVKPCSPQALGVTLLSVETHFGSKLISKKLPPSKPKTNMTIEPKLATCAGVLNRVAMNEPQPLAAKAAARISKTTPRGSPQFRRKSRLVPPIRMVS